MKESRRPKSERWGDEDEDAEVNEWCSKGNTRSEINTLEGRTRWD